MIREHIGLISENLFYNLLNCFIILFQKRLIKIIPKMRHRYIGSHIHSLPFPNVVRHNSNNYRHSLKKSLFVLIGYISTIFYILVKLVRYSGGFIASFFLKHRSYCNLNWKIIKPEAWDIAIFAWFSHEWVRHWLLFALVHFQNENVKNKLFCINHILLFFFFFFFTVEKNERNSH